MKKSPAITAAQERISDAKADRDRLVAEVQSSCEHLIVSECAYQSSQYLSPLMPRRICNHCCLEEEGSHWSGGTTWSKADYSGPAVLGNKDGRIVVPVSRETVYRMRAV
jgi:hypothetical protein